MLEDGEKRSCVRAFSDSPRPKNPLNQYGVCPKEWWLNVNYAEIIEIKDAVGIHVLKARLAN